MRHLHGPARGRRGRGAARRCGPGPRHGRGRDRSREGPGGARRDPQRGWPQDLGRARRLPARSRRPRRRDRERRRPGTGAGRPAAPRGRRLCGELRALGCYLAGHRRYGTGAAAAPGAPRARGAARPSERRSGPADRRSSRYRRRGAHALPAGRAHDLRAQGGRLACPSAARSAKAARARAPAPGGAVRRGRGQSRGVGRSRHRGHGGARGRARARLSAHALAQPARHAG